MSNRGIKFVSASEGGLEFIIETAAKPIVRRADSIEDGVYMVERYGFCDSHYFTSSMDFASEEGFLTDGCAKVMFDQIMAVATGTDV